MDKQVRSPPIHAGQYEIFVAYLEQHQQMRTGVGDPHTHAVLWENLTTKLNAYGAGPSKETAKWKASFKQWKHKVRHEARMSKVQGLATGDGPASTIELNDLKERALNAWGSIAVDGNNIGEIGRAVVQPTSSIDRPFTSVSSATPGAGSLQYERPEPETPSRKWAKKSQRKEARENDDNMADAISRLADQMGEVAATMNQMVANQERNIGLLLEKLLT